MTPDRIIKIPDMLQLQQLAHLYPALPLGIPLADCCQFPSVSRDIKGQYNGLFHIRLDESTVNFSWENNPDVYLYAHIMHDHIASINLHPQIIDGDRVQKELQELKPDAFVNFILQYFNTYGHDIRTISSFWSTQDVNGRNLQRLQQEPVPVGIASGMRDAQIYAKYGYHVRLVETHPSDKGERIWFVKFKKKS